MLRKSAMLGTKRKIPKRFALNWNDYEHHPNLSISKLDSSKEQYDAMKAQDEESKEEE